MSDQRRDGKHPSRFSREIRPASAGGTIPDEWGCRVIDLDEFYARLDGELVRVRTPYRLWAWWRLPIEIVALAEQKHHTDPQQSWDVTRVLALQAGTGGFRVVAMPDGTRRITDLDGATQTVASTREFVGEFVRPLIEAF